jgi:hypothetical protein
VSARARVEENVLACFGLDYEPDADEVARSLVDEDVAAGEYEGCSSELELAYIEYEALAREALAAKGA